MADYNQNKRLRKLIEEVFNMSPVEFAKKYNDPKAVKTYNILSERNGISNNMLEEITNAYPSINKIWLLTGEGDPIKDSLPSIPKDDFIRIESEVFSNKILEMFSNGEIYSKSFVEEKDRQITDLNRIIGSLQEKIRELELKLMDYEKNKD